MYLFIDKHIRSLHVFIFGVDSTYSASETQFRSMASCCGFIFSDGVQHLMSPTEMSIESKFVSHISKIDDLGLMNSTNSGSYAPCCISANFDPSNCYRASTQ